MYFPILAARGEENKALMQVACISSTSKVIPILIPFHEEEDQMFSYKSLVSITKFLVDKKNKFILLISNEEDIHELRNNVPDLDSYCIRGFKFKFRDNIKFEESVKYALIHHDQDLSTSFDDRRIEYHVFMPIVSGLHNYIGMYPIRKRVLIEDGFIKHEPNSQYPPPDHFNSQLWRDSKLSSIAGFGDFTILGKDFIPTQQAKQSTVSHVIHLSCQESGTLHVCHYLTTPTQEIDIKNRSISTIKKAYDDLDRHVNSSAKNLIIKLYNRQMPTSLGMYKRIGIIHHIELICSLI